MALISSSTEENTEFEVPKSFASYLGTNETATCLYCKYRITKVTLFKNAAWQSVAMYTGRSSQPRPRSSLLSQKHYGVELNFILIHLSGYGGIHPQDK